jgi:tetratricopeptide (TPR) repeat protein
MSKKLYLVAVSVLMCVALFGTHISAQNGKQSLASVSQAEAKAWQDDLRYLAAEAPKWHKNLFHTITPAQFQDAVNRLHERIPALARHEIIVEMARIVAMIGDGHTNIAPTRDPKIGFRALPLKFYLFKDGLFVRAASRENAELVGARVVKIGNLPPEEAIKRAGEIVGADNEMNPKFFAPHLLAMPEILHALKITDTPDSVALTVRHRSGKEQTVNLKQFGAPELLPPDTDTSWVNKEGWVDMRDGATAQAPLWLKKDPNDKFWFELLPDSRTVYVQMNQVLNKENETIEDFARRLFAFVEKSGVEKLIFDVRLNRGGNNVLLRPLLLEAIKSKVNQRGKLFVIMGRSTWSAAQFFVDDFEKYTNAVFVGEPTGSKGNHYADSRRITLPNSGVTARVSIYYWQDWAPWDTRVWTTPEASVELSSDDYRNNIDPALNFALNYAPRPKLTELLNEALTKGGADSAIKTFREFKADPLNKYAATEEPLLIAGDRLLGEKKPEQALILFRLNLEENPKPARGYFAVGEAYLQMSNKEQAIKYFEKALELDPKYYIANERLKAARKN